MKHYVIRVLSWTRLCMILPFLTFPTLAQDQEVIRYGYEVVHQYPHDVKAFTQGLLFVDGALYESTGRYGESTVRRVSLTDGKVEKSTALANKYFGEGLVNWNDRLINLTWRSNTALVFDKQSFKEVGRFTYKGEGWGLTQNGKHLVMSDGTPEIRFLDPESLKKISRITVNYNNQAIGRINELEWVKGEIFANVWQSDWILRIDPKSGNVLGLIDMKGLLPKGTVSDPLDHVLNGIAYDAEQDRLFVTGKKWPSLFEIKLVVQP